MEDLITGKLLRSCASPASIDKNDIPVIESEKAPVPTSPPSKKSSSLPWYAWFLIAIGIVLVIAAAVYIWWVLSSRRKHRESRIKLAEAGESGSGERGIAFHCHLCIPIFAFKCVHGHIRSARLER
mmetsp:Transcript_658/g.548  ORF Transcript_658/g.548 Transcript_658/m.548 type:complete len:126 (+) Transcript_658:184-561(+)